MIYFDTSALVTEITERGGVVALRAFLREHLDDQGATSTVGLIETVRNCDATGSFPNLLPRLLQDYAELPVTGGILNSAAFLSRRLHTLDAIHLASAQSLQGELTVLVTFDPQLAEAARGLGLPVAMPGVE